MSLLTCYRGRHQVSSCSRRDWVYRVQVRNLRSLEFEESGGGCLKQLQGLGWMNNSLVEENYCLVSRSSREVFAGRCSSEGQNKNPILKDRPSPPLRHPSAQIHSMFCGRTGMLHVKAPGLVSSTIKTCKVVSGCQEKSLCQIKTKVKF